MSDIQEQLIQAAAERLGYASYELPPDYRKLLSLVGWRIQHLHGQLNQSNSRILKSFLQRVTPKTAGRAYPAWAVGLAQPASADTVLLPRHTFFTSQQLYFSPAFPSRLLKARVAVQMVRGRVNKYPESSPAESVDLILQKDMPAKTLWLGIQLDNRLDSMNGATFFVDWPETGLERKAKMYGLLPFLQWKMEGTDVRIARGFTPAKDSTLPDFPSEEFFYRRTVEVEVLRQSQNGFFSIVADPGLLPKRRKYPEYFDEYLDQESLKTCFTEPLVWLRLDFPDGFSPEEVFHSCFSLNAFPIINRRVEKSKDFVAREEMQVVKLTDFNPQVSGEWGREYFACLQNIWSNECKAYRPVAFSSFDPNETPAGAYALQYGNVEAWERGDAWEKITFLLQELEEQTSGFGAGEREELGRLLKGLKQNMKALQERLDAYQGSPNYYLNVKACQPGEHIFLEYWMTQGERANDDVLAPTFLQGEVGAVLDGRIVLLTHPSGGKGPPIGANWKRLRLLHFTTFLFRK